MARNGSHVTVRIGCHLREQQQKSERGGTTITMARDARASSHARKQRMIDGYASKEMSATTLDKILGSGNVEGGCPPKKRSKLDGVVEYRQSRKFEWSSLSESESYWVTLRPGENVKTCSSELASSSSSSSSNSSSDQQ